MEAGTAWVVGRARAATLRHGAVGRAGHLDTSRAQRRPPKPASSCASALPLLSVCARPVSMRTCDQQRRARCCERSPASAPPRGAAASAHAAHRGPCRTHVLDAGHHTPAFLPTSEPPGTRCKVPDALCQLSDDTG
jgi:hypothetical protein